ncbi:MAG TPA: tetratricopeptide repeat protein [Polyangia bacterium]|nr:tetratricopeptide repeat protein [Polyangia bacterium]
MKTRRFVTAMAVALGLATGLALPRAAQAADADAEAKKIYQQGVDAFEDGRFDDAALAFRQAYDLKPSWKLLYNMGQSEAAARRYGLALDAFEKYLVGGGDEIQGDRREEVLAEIQRLRVLVGVVEVRAPDGTEFLLDGYSYGRTPFPGPVRVAAGEHQAVLRRGDEVLLEKKIGIAGGMTTTLAAEAGVKAPPAGDPAEKKQEPVGEEPGPAEGEEPGTESGGRVWTWVALGVGVAAVAGGGITGGLAMGREKDLLADCSDNHCPFSLKGEADTIKNMNLTADILYGVGAAAIIAGIVLFFVEPTGEAEAPVAFAPAVGDGLGLSVAGRF